MISGYFQDRIITIDGEGQPGSVETVDADAFPGLRFYIEAIPQVDEWLVGRRSPIHWFVAGEWNTLKEEVYRDLTSPADAVAELQKRAVTEWEAQGL